MAVHFLDMQSVVDFAFARNNGAVPSSQLLEDRDSKRLPQQLAMMIPERRVA